MKGNPLRTSLAICLTALIALAATPVAAGGEFSRLVVFGDSLSDPSNAFWLLREIEVPPFELIPDAPYATLHFTNGVTWAERLGKALGVPLSTGPALLVPKLFSNYAVGAARARPEGVFDLTTQVNRFVADFQGKAPARALYVVFIGGNDLRDALNALADDPSGFTSGQMIGAALSAIGSNIAALAERGARTFLVANAPNVALVPAVRLLGSIAQFVAQQLSMAFNDGLELTLSGLEASLPITIVRLDVFALLNQVVTDPASFGLSQVEDSCITPGVLIGAVCSNPDHFLFWDGIHPTRAGHKILAGEAQAVLAAP